jgi:DNA uptake protein ComE-like DNA-binding protein
MRTRWTTLLLACVLTGCSCNNTQSLKEHTADVTAAAKRDAGAIAGGIVEGLERKGPLDINSATSKQLETLPGITPPLAHAIVDGRPYADPKDLTRKHILTKPQLERIRAQIEVRKQGL